MKAFACILRVKPTVMMSRVVNAQKADGFTRSSSGFLKVKGAVNGQITNRQFQQPDRLNPILNDVPVKHHRLCEGHPMRGRTPSVCTFLHVTARSVKTFSLHSYSRAVIHDRPSLCHLPSSSPNQPRYTLRGNVRRDIGLPDPRLNEDTSLGCT